MGNAYSELVFINILMFLSVTGAMYYKNVGIEPGSPFMRVNDRNDWAMLLSLIPVKHLPQQLNQSRDATTLEDGKQASSVV